MKQTAPVTTEFTLTEVAQVIGALAALDRLVTCTGMADHMVAAMAKVKAAFGHVGDEEDAKVSIVMDSSRRLVVITVG